ncbi:NADPH-dependent F420 reductase [Rhizobium sp.]|uniref:NADPH-dependent F420 reductase n=1 Tax=Rhizobium sp. TaxID=391 RepID=UPI002F19F779
MKIGIIGVGAIGGALARKYVANGHDVKVANSRGVDAVKEFAGSIGAQATDAQGAVDGVDAIIISIPYLGLEKLPEGFLVNVPSHVPVIDTCNYYPGVRDPNIADIDAGKPESLWASERLGRGVIKAFNNIEADALANQGKPKGTAGRIALPVAGDDSVQKASALALVEEMGFDGFDAGSLQDSWRQQPNTPVYSTDFPLEDAKNAIASAVQGVAPKRRDEFLAGAMTFWEKYPTPASRTEYFRVYNATNAASAS